MDEPIDKKSPEDALHARAMEAYQTLSDAWADNRKLALEDIKFRAGDHWPEEMKTAVAAEGNTRPMLVVDKVNQYVRQVVNDARQNRPSVKFRPVDDFGDKEVAEAFQGLFRHDYQKSKAEVAVDNATECAVVGGYGYLRVITDYVSRKSFNQEIRFEKIGNPLSVLLGLPGEDPLKAMDAFIVDEMPKSEFKKRYPNAKKTDFDSDGYREAWVTDKNVRYAEWFYVEQKDEDVHLLEDGTTCEDDEYQAAIQELGAERVPPIVETRKLPVRHVKWCRISGAEVLEQSEWLGKYIPIVRVVGNEYNIEGKVIYSGLIRAAKDPQRLYNYMRSRFAERVALTPKSPWMIAAGQVEGYEAQWNNANNEAAVLIYQEKSLDGHPVPPPMRVAPSDIPEGFARDMQLSEHDIQASMGMYAASIGQQGNERSGKAIMARQREGDTATFHYQDNAARAIRDLGIIYVDLAPKIYDSRRGVRIMAEDGSTTQAEIDPKQEQPVVRMGGKAIYNIGAGEFDVVVDTGPSFTTKRVEQAEAMMEIVHNNPQAWNTHGDLIAKAQDWPQAQEWAERSLLFLPPPIQQALQKDENLSPDAKMLKAQADMAIQQRDQQIQEMQQALQESNNKALQLEANLAKVTGKAATDAANAAVEQANAQLEVMQKEVELLKAQKDLIEANRPQGDETEYVMTEGGPIPFEQWKVLVENSTKVLIEEIRAKTTVKTSAISASSKGDGSTVIDGDGETKPNPALSSLIEAVNSNMQALLQGNMAISDGIRQMASAKRVARRDKDGNLYSEVVQ